MRPMSRIKLEAERVTIYRMVIDIVQRFDAPYRQYHGREDRSLGSSLETYLIVAAVFDRRSGATAVHGE